MNAARSANTSLIRWREVRHNFTHRLKNYRKKILTCAITTSIHLFLSPQFSMELRIDIDKSNTTWLLRVKLLGLCSVCPSVFMAVDVFEISSTCTLLVRATKFSITFVIRLALG